MSIAGSEGSSAHSTDGGEGGNIVLIGVEGKGESKNDNGGSINLQGGNLFEGCGRSLILLSGQSTKSSSGDVLIASAPSGYEDGLSGTLTLKTGKVKGGHGASGAHCEAYGHPMPSGAIKFQVD